MQVIDLNQFEVLEEEYEDLRFGTIQILNNIETNQMIMCKSIQLMFKDQYIKNLEILQQRKNINNRNILNLLQIVEDEQNLSLQVYYDYPTNDIISMKEELSTDLKLLKKLMQDILNSLQILKRNKFVHSEISPEYIYYNSEQDCFVLLDRLNNRQSFIEVQKDMLQKQSFLYQSPNLFEQLITDSNDIEMDPYEEEIFQLGMVVVDILSPDEFNFQKVYNFPQQKFDHKFFSILKQKIEFYYFYGENRKQLGDILFQKILDTEQKPNLQNIIDSLQKLEDDNVEFASQNQIQTQEKFQSVQTDSENKDDFFNINVNPSKEKNLKESMFQTFGGDKLIQSFKMKTSIRNNENTFNNSVISEDMPPSLKEKLNLAGSMHFRNSLFKESQNKNQEDNEVKAENFRSLGKDQDIQTSQNFFENALLSPFDIEQNQDPSHTNVYMDYSKSALTDMSNLHNSFEPKGTSQPSINSLTNKKKSNTLNLHVKSNLKTAQNSLQKVPFQHQDEFLHSQKFSQSLDCGSKEDLSENDFNQNEHLGPEVSENTEKIIMLKESSQQQSYSQVQLSNNDQDSILNKEHSIESNTSTIKNKKTDKQSDLKQRRYSKDIKLQNQLSKEQKSLLSNSQQIFKVENFVPDDQSQNQDQTQIDVQKIENDQVQNKQDDFKQAQKEKRRMLQKNYSGTNFVARDRGQSLLVEGLCLDKQTKEKLNKLIEQESKSQFTEELSKDELQQQIQNFFQENKQIYNEEDYHNFDDQSLLTMNEKISLISAAKLLKNPSNLTQITKLSKNKIQLQSTQRLGLKNDAFEIQKLQNEIRIDQEKRKKLEEKQQQRLSKFQEQNELEKKQLEIQRQQYLQKLQEEEERKQKEQENQKQEESEDEILYLGDEDLKKLDLDRQESLSANTQSVHQVLVQNNQPMQNVFYEQYQTETIQLQQPQTIDIQTIKQNNIQNVFTYNNNVQIQQFLKEKQKYENLIEKLKQDYLLQQEQLKKDLEQQKIQYQQELEQEKQKAQEEKAQIDQVLEEEKSKMEIEKAKLNQELLSERQKIEEEKQNINKEFVRKKTEIEQKEQEILDNYETQKQQKLKNLESITSEIHNNTVQIENQKKELQKDLDLYKDDLQKQRETINQQFDQEKEDLMEKKKKLQEQLKLEQQQLEDEKQKLEIEKNKLQLALKEAKENYEKDKINFNEEFSNMKNEKLETIKTLENQINQLKVQIKDLEGQKDQKQQEVEELQIWQQGIQADIESNKQVLQEYKDAIEKSKQQLISFQNEYQQLENIRNEHQEKTQQQLNTQKKTISKIKSNLRKLIKKDKKFDYQGNQNYMKSIFSKLKQKMTKKDKKLDEILEKEKQKMEEQLSQEQKKFIQMQKNFQEILDKKDSDILNQKQLNESLQKLLQQQQELIDLKKQHQHKIQQIHNILSSKKQKQEEKKDDDSAFKQQLSVLEYKQKEIRYEQQKLKELQNNVKLELELLDQQKLIHDTNIDTERKFQKDEVIQESKLIPLRQPQKKYESKRNVSVVKSKNIGFEKRISPRTSNYNSNFYQTQIDNLPTQRKIILPIQPKVISKSILPIRVQGHNRSSSNTTEIKYMLNSSINQNRGCKVTYSKKYTMDQNDNSQVNLLPQDLGQSKIELLRKDNWASVYRYKNDQIIQFKLNHNVVILFFLSNQNL